jgi:hypothetical protein
MQATVSIQVRRGDYLKNPDKFCGMCSIEYYYQAIRYMEGKVDNPYYVVLSDDIEWVKENLHIENAIYVEENMFDEYSDWYDMYIMTCCKHNIIANSSFNNEDTPDIWCDGWIKIGKDETLPH